MLDAFESALFGIFLFSLLFAYVLCNLKRFAIWLSTLFILILVYFFHYYCVVIL